MDDESIDSWCRQDSGLWSTRGMNMGRAFILRCQVVRNVNDSAVLQIATQAMNSQYMGVS
jgi:hypothetical protein